MIIAFFWLLSVQAQQYLTDLGSVRVEYVAADHWGVSNGAVAKAALLNDGRRWIFVNSAHDQTDIDQWILHEMAHHVAWQRHGIEIAEHGPEFRRICRELVTRREAYFCRGD